LVVEAEGRRVGMGPVGRGDVRAEQLARVVADLDLRVRAHGVEAILNWAAVDALDPEPLAGGPGERLRAHLHALEIELRGLRAAIRILEVDEAVAVVVDAVPTDLLGLLAEGGPAAAGVVAVGQAVAVVVDAVAADLGRGLTYRAPWSRLMLAGTVDAGVVGAGVCVVAIGRGRALLAAGDGRELAAAVLGALVGRARVAVVAVVVLRAGGAKRALGAHAHAALGAGVVHAGGVVVALGRHRAGLAPVDRLVRADPAGAGVRGAAVLVIALCRGLAEGAARNRRVGAGPRLGITHSRGVAAVLRLALEGCPGQAGPRMARVGLGAGVAVAAAGAVGLRGVRAGAGRRVAGAHVVALIRRGAGHRVGADADSGLAAVGLS